MAYQVLARKYRPQRFSDVVGQEHVTRTLLNALTQGRTAHGYIFSGHRGIGKTTIARILAMALNCRTLIGSHERPTAEPCSVCESCTEIKAGNAVDVIEIDAATNRGIDEIRELRDAARYAPARDRYKIYILDEAHQITDAAFNALLKTLEEPPDHVVFMMATTQPEDIPQTIRSRCQHFSFHAVKFDDILTQLRTIAAAEHIGAEDAALALLAEAGDGSMRDALSIMDQAIASAPHEDGIANLSAEQIRELMGAVPNTVFERLLEAVSENQSAAVLVEINRLLNAGNSPSQLARQLVRYLRNALMARLGGESTELLQISPDERARCARTAILFSEEDLTRFLNIMLRTFDDLNYRQEQRFHLELGLLKLVHAQRLIPVEEFLSKLPASGGGRGVPPPGRIRTGGALPAARVSTSPAPRLSTATPAAPRISVNPGFSPFETDSAPEQRESAPGPASGPMADAAPVLETSTLNATIAPRSTISPRSTSSQSSSPQSTSPQSTSAQSISQDTPDVPLSAAPMVAPRSVNGDVDGSPGADAGPNVDPNLDPNLDKVREAITSALDNAGHQTAATLLGAGVWTLSGDVLQAAVPSKKTMLALSMNPEAAQIAKAALRTLGVSYKLNVIPGEADAIAAAPKPRPATSGDTSSALDHPLVKQAREIFQAEVRGILDLSDKR